MDVILKVLEGAKTGTKIAVKKDEFLIGRSQKCHLCAGSSSVSRQHCAITRADAAVSIQDLDSRNGTLVNGKKITEKVQLSSGDELGIGTLKMQVTITHGITNLKRPKVKTVAEAIDRTAAAGDSDIGEEDITQWLLDAPGPPATISANETQTIQLDDTKSIELRKEIEKRIQADADQKPGAETEESADVTGKEKKAEPGKLPPVPKDQGTKDSREAAMEALRNFNRRR
jgi:pSer/pThr/pTyr-binding forkhead associated (FHA) protein